MNLDDNKLLSEVKNIKLEYHRKWREKNKDKVKKINERYWLNGAKKELEKKEKCQNERNI